MVDFMNCAINILFLQAALFVFGRPGGLYASIFFAERQAKKDFRSNP
jgi:hypothetical protein